MLPLPFFRSFARRARGGRADVQAPLLRAHEIDDVAAQAAQALALHHWQIIRGPQPGDWVSPDKGQGLDFEEVRPYQPGDDVRHLDWRSTARLGQPYVKTFHEERQQVWLLALDRSLSMRFGTQTRLKVAQGARAALFMAFAAQQLGVALRLSTWDGQQVDAATALPGAGLAQTALDLFNLPCPPWLAPVASRGESARAAASAPQDFAAWVEGLARQAPAGARVWVVSDARPWQPTEAEVVRELATRHALTWLRIADPAEHTLPNVGWADFATPGWQGGHRQPLPSGSLALQHALATFWHDNCRRQDAVLQAAGADVIDINVTVDDLTPSLCHG